MISVENAQDLQGEKPFYLIIQFIPSFGGMEPTHGFPFGIPDCDRVEISRTESKEEYLTRLKKLFESDPTRTDVAGLLVTNSETITITP